MTGRIRYSAPSLLHLQTQQKEEPLMKQTLVVLVLAVLGVGCASTQPQEREAYGYSTANAGAYTHTPPGTGLRPIGQPGQEARELPRTPHKRVLPPTKEPTLFSAESPRGMEGPPGWEQRHPIVLSVELPMEMPEVKDAEAIIYVENVRACAVIAHTILTTIMSEAEILKLKAHEARCLALSLHSLCAVKDLARFEWAAKRIELKDFLRRAFERNARVSKAAQEEACRRRGAFNDRVFNHYTKAALRWETFDWRWPGGG
jgi:hypothetical protein